MKTIETSKYTKYTLELIFSEADKLAGHILKSISENRNKSFILFGLLSSLFSFAFFKVVECNFEYVIILLGAFIGCVLLDLLLFQNIEKQRYT